MSHSSPGSVRLIAALLLGAAFLVLSAPAGAQEPEDAPTEVPSVCRERTPPDAPHGCVEVIPPGASVWVTLDGVQYGLSPVGIPELAPGEHTLRLDREGDWPQVSTFRLEPAEVRRFDAPLPRLAERIVPPGPAEPYPLAVMIENLPEARPHFGLDQADVVYDALAEGGISRFMALYLTREADAIGPVRSTRHYFVYIAAEYNATLVHVGASPIGYAALGATRIRNVNESWGDPGLWRSARRYAPHNAFTSTLDARAAADAKAEGGAGTWGPLELKDPADRMPGPSAPLVRVRYPPLGWYSVSYAYDASTNRYLRHMDGEPHVDAGSGTHLAASAVIVQVVPDEVIDREGRLDLAQTGEGRAYYFQDGTTIEGYWTKADFGSRTQFWDTAGNRVRFNADGTTWIQIVPPEAVVQVVGEREGDLN
jgi:hypothetical protein